MSLASSTLLAANRQLTVPVAQAPNESAIDHDDTNLPLSNPNKAHNEGREAWTGTSERRLGGRKKSIVEGKAILQYFFDNLICALCYEAADSVFLSLLFFI